MFNYLNSDPATAEEIQKVKDNNTLSLPGRWETIRAISSDLAQIVTYGLSDDYWNTYTDNVRSLTKERLDDAAKKSIKPENLTWVIVGDLDEIEDKIKKLDVDQIIKLDAEGRRL